MTEYYLVDVKSVISNVPRSNFKVDDLEQLANSILVAGGLLTPLILKQVAPEKYEVLAGDLEYYAALRAKEINPRQGEMVNAFVVPPKQQEAAIAQVIELKKNKEIAIPSDHPIPAQATSNETNSRLTNLESRLDSAIRDLKLSQEKEVKRLEQELNEIKRQVPQRVEPLEAFNNLDTSELAQKLATANIRGKTAEKLIIAIQKERKKTPFTSLSDVVKRINGLGDKRMLSIVDTWGGMY